MVLVTRLELVRYRYRGILSPLCLPIPPHQPICHFYVLRLFSWLVKVAILIRDFLLISNGMYHVVSSKTHLFIKTKNRSILLSNDEGVNQFLFKVCFKVRTSRHHIDSIDTRIRTQDLLYVSSTGALPAELCQYEHCIDNAVSAADLPSAVKVF